MVPNPIRPPQVILLPQLPTPKPLKDGHLQLMQFKLQFRSLSRKMTSKSLLEHEKKIFEFKQRMKKINLKLEEKNKEKSEKGEELEKMKESHRILTAECSAMDKKINKEAAARKAAKNPGNIAPKKHKKKFNALEPLGDELAALKKNIEDLVKEKQRLQDTIKEHLRTARTFANSIPDGKFLSLLSILQHRKRQARVLELGDYFKQNSLLLPEADKQEFLEFLPKFVGLIKKDANMMKKMETVQDEQGLKSLPTGWYSRLNNLTENEMERLNEWLEKFEKQVMGALRQRINIKAADSFQRIFTFFEQLIEKALHRKMRHITADELQQKLRQKDL
ncbi:unnamed protein product [Caenorhabditis brenneri]